MNFKTVLLAFSLLAAPLAAQCGSAALTKGGVRFTEGTLSLTLSYPQLTDAAGKPVKPQVELESPALAKLDYGEGRTAEVRLGEDGKGAIAFTGRGQTRPRMELNIPTDFADGGKWTLGAASGEFPRQPEKAVFARESTNQFSVTAPGGETLTFSGSAWFQLQDNRKFKWNVFQMQIAANMGSDTWNFRWELSAPQSAGNAR